MKRSVCKNLRKTFFHKLCNLLPYVIIAFPKSYNIWNPRTVSRSKYRYSLVLVNVKYGIQGVCLKTQLVGSKAHGFKPKVRSMYKLEKSKYLNGLRQILFQLSQKNYRGHNDNRPPPLSRNRVIYNHVMPLLKEFSLCHKLCFSKAYILGFQCRRP